MAILAATLLAAWAYRRPFCRAICPLGAIFSLFNRVSLVRLHWDEDACRDCMWCVRECPQGLDPRREVSSHACIGCLRCVGCPFGAIKVTTALASCGSGNVPDAPSEGADV